MTHPNYLSVMDGHGFAMFDTDFVTRIFLLTHIHNIILMVPMNSVHFIDKMSMVQLYASYHNMTNPDLHDFCDFPLPYARQCKIVDFLSSGQCQTCSILLEESVLSEGDWLPCKNCAMKYNSTTCANYRQ